MKRTLLGALLLATSLTAPMAKADRVYYYDDEPVVTRHRVYSEQRYIEPRSTYRRDNVRVYRSAPVYDDERVTYRDYRDDHPRYILPPGPHRLIQHILFGDPMQ
jgi:hypothetical protein